MTPWRLPPFAHQERALAFAQRREFYALLMEQGTGKTAVLLNDAALRWSAGGCDALLVFAPNGVHTNWLLREAPAHLPEGCEWEGAAWYAGATREEERRLEEVCRVERGRGPLRVLTMNWEALATERGYEMAARFLHATRAAMMVGDESQRMKNIRAHRTRSIFRLRDAARFRAISSGTAITRSPWDAFAQFSFLREGLLGTRSFSAFRAEYAELLPPGHGLLRHIAQRTRGRYTPQIVARDENGQPRWRNLDQLQRLIAPHAFRVLKEECLDLPPKAYTQRYFRLTPTQARAYTQLRDELRYKLTSGELRPVERIAAITKLSQIVSGYILGPDGTVQRIVPTARNEKLRIAVDEIEGCLEREGGVIVWARFHVEIDDLISALLAKGIEAVQYDGRTKPAARTSAIDRFQRGEVRVFIGQPASGGTGITLTAARNVLYYSNSWSLEDRLQSEDRAHRIGQRSEVRYVDILAPSTIDESIALSLRAKTDLARVVMGDAGRIAGML
jgi:SNF2 family DNA or RNA helicase